MTPPPQRRKGTAGPDMDPDRPINIKGRKTKISMLPMKTAALSSGNQVYLPKEVLEEANIEEGSRFLVRVHDGIIELVPEALAEKALDAGLANLKRASMARLTELWDNPEDEAWNEA